MDPATPFRQKWGITLALDNAPFVKNALKQARTIKPAREQPAARSAISQVEPERILLAVTKRFRISIEEIVRNRYRGPARSMAMELL